MNEPLKTPPDIAYLAQLKAVGVHSFEFNDPANDYSWSVAFFPSAPTASESQIDLSAAAAEACKCGHAVMEHNEHGECLRGCAASVCEAKT